MVVEHYWLTSTSLSSGSDVSLLADFERDPSRSPEPESILPDVDQLERQCHELAASSTATGADWERVPTPERERKTSAEFAEERRDRLPPPPRLSAPPFFAASVAAPVRRQQPAQGADQPARSAGDTASVRLRPGGRRAAASRRHGCSRAQERLEPPPAWRRWRRCNRSCRSWCLEFKLWPRT